MSGRFLCTAVAAILCMAPEARALEATWSNGNPDLRFQLARRCTLIVRTTSPGEALPSEWRLSWVAMADAEIPLGIVSESGGADTARVCDLTDALTATDVVSRLQTASFCAAAGGARAVVAAYVLDAAAGVRGKIHVVPVPPGLGSTTLGLAAPSLEVTLNGGWSGPYSPMLLSGSIARSGNLVTLAARGADLHSVSSVSYVTAGDLRRIPFAVVSATDSLLLAQATLASSLPSGRLEAATAQGFIGAVAMTGEAPLPAATATGDALVVRFRSHVLASSGGAGPTPLSQLHFAPADLGQTLLDAGVTALEPVFPWFKHSDVRSTNLIGEPVELDDLADYYWAHVADGTDLGAAAASVGLANGVLYAGLDYGSTPALFTAPNDPLYGKQWTLRDTSQVLCGLTAAYGIDAQAYFAWDRTTGSPDVRVAVLDTGIDTTHVELSSPPRVRGGPAFVQPAVQNSYDDDTGGHHGTAVTGIIAATGNNAIGIAGLGWQVVPWAIKVLRGSDGFSRASWVAQGISWATANQFPILNMSIGFPELACPFAGTPIPVDSANIMAAACLNALYSGALSVAGMGNCDVSVKFWPAAFTRRVYAVGAEFLDGLRWEDYNFADHNSVCPLPSSCAGSTWGNWIDALAPGGRLVVTLAQGPASYIDIAPDCNAQIIYHMAFGGTSSSTAVAAGAAALLKSYNGNLLGEDIEQVLDLTALHAAFPWDDRTGYGLIEPAGALGNVRAPQLLLHGTLGHPGTFGALTDIESLQVNRTFNNVPGLPANRSYTCWRHKMRGTAQFNAGFQFSPNLWVRASGSFGWKDTLTFDYNYEVNTDSILSWSATSATFQTYVYRIIDPADLTHALGWFPKPPDSAVVAFTALGYSALADVELPASQRFLSIHTWPNPAASRISLDLTLPSRGWLRAAVLDVSGRRMTQLADGNFEQGTRHLQWDGRSDRGERCAAGVYFLQVEFAGRSATRRFVLLGVR